MSKPKIKYIGQNIFPVYIGITFCESDYLLEMRRLAVKEPPEFYSSTASVKYFTKGEHLTCIICFDPVKYKKLDRNQKVAVIAHEVVHVVDFAFEHVGENKPGYETRAYFVQAILQECLYAMDDFMKGKNHGRKKHS